MTTTGVERQATRAFAAGAFNFVVNTVHDDDRLLVESLFRDLPTPASPGSDIAIFSLLRSGRNADAWVVGTPASGEQPGPTLAAALDRLVSAVNFAALDAEPESLHLHAAAATNEGRAVVIAARRNTGKTTLVAHLAVRGWGFVTDETVRLSAGTEEVSGFAKPIGIKPEGRELLAHLQPWMLPPIGDDPDGQRFVPIGASGASVVNGGLPHLVVLLRRPLVDDQVEEMTAGPVARRLHPADAVVALMQETLDAERFGATAFRLATFAAASHSFQLEVGTPEETADEVERLFRLDRPEPVEVAILPPSDAFSPGVVSMAIGDRAVVHETVSGRIFALDPGATRVWRELGWRDDHSDVDLHGPVTAPFVEQLRALGVLAGAA